MASFEVSNSRWDRASLGSADASGRESVLPKALVSLSTGRGVHIGDTTKEVVDPLGLPTKAKRTGKAGQSLEYRYHWRTTDQTYTFKNAKLIEIDFERDDSPG